MVAYPVVPKGVIMLRLIPTAVHTFTDVYKTVAVFKEISLKLKSGVYKTEDTLNPSPLEQIQLKV